MSVVRINALDVPAEAGPELERRFAARTGAVEGSDGFLGFQLLRPTAGETRYFVVTHWTDEASYVAWRDSEARAASGAHRRETVGKPVAQGSHLLEFDVVLDVKPA